MRCFSYSSDLVWLYIRLCLIAFVLCAAMQPPKALAATPHEIASLQAEQDPEINQGLPANLRMFVGDIKLFHLKRPIKTVAVGNGKVLSSSTIENGDLLVLAQDAGDTTVHVWNNIGQHFVTRIRVELKDMNRVSEEIRNALGNNPALTVRAAGEHVLIEGQNVSLSTSKMIDAVTKLYPQATNMTMMSSKYELLEPMIIYELHFIEFKNTKLESIGVKWDSQSIGGIKFGYSDKGFTAETNVSFGSVINLAIENGDAYVLAAPKLSSRSGGKAKFLAGGEVPLQSIGINGNTTIVFKQYGIILNLEGSVIGSNGISGSVQAEVSSIDSSVTVQGLPGFLTRRTESEFNMHEGESLVLSGLLSKENAKSIDKVPLLGSIPIIGEFFKSKNVTGKDVELVVFITPHVYASESNLNKTAIKNGIDGLNRTSEMLGDGHIIEENKSAEEQKSNTSQINPKDVSTENGK